MFHNQVQEDHNYGEPGPSTLRHSRRINHHSQLQRSSEDLEKSHVNNAENHADPLRIPENISGRLRNRTPRNITSVDDESDPDDDKPLRLMVTESPIRSRSSRQSTRYSDEHVMTQTPPTGPLNAATSSTRSGRMRKRPHYNEDSDEEDSNPSKRQTTLSRYEFTFWN